MKNLKSFVCNTISLLVSILFLIFMGQPHYLTLGKFSGEVYGQLTGYDYLKFSSDDGKAVVLGVGLLLATIFACILILTSIYGILRSFELVKSNKADQIVRFVNLASATLFVVSMVLALIMGICIVSEHNADEIVSEIYTAQCGWALATNFVLPVLSLLAVCFDKNKKAKKTSKKSK